MGVPTGDGKVTEQSIRIWGLEHLLEIDGWILPSNDWGHVEVLILVQGARVFEGAFVLGNMVQRLLGRRKGGLNSLRYGAHR